MREFKLDVTKIEGMEEYEGISGHVKVNVPSMKERIGVMKKSGISADGDSLDAAMKLMEAGEALVLEVDVKYMDVHCTSYDDLGYYAFGTAIAGAISKMVLNGIPLGKI